MLRRPAWLRSCIDWPGTCRWAPIGVGEKYGVDVMYAEIK
ncbi:hypothetical protein HMPREF3150_02561 [Pseudomonas aeruginosa]|nr:hypothetical protein HMPREF3150_02561 [Pseudomonas aeruginosa]